jgi:hypothetical protein
MARTPDILGVFDKVHQLADGSICEKGARSLQCRELGQRDLA